MQIDIEALAQATAKRTNMILEEKAKEALRELIREVVKEEILANLRLYYSDRSSFLSLEYSNTELNGFYLD